jgi:3-deoxy-D-manno-octulosonate 8-phosphate phosphatase (KDO 8-P phosphatase)
MTQSSIPEQVIEKAKNIELVALDVDGVMTNGGVFFSAQGDELKEFNILDGQGIKALMKHNIEVAIITGRTSALTARRAKDLGIKNILQGREDKKVALKEMCSELDISFDKICYVGDDLPDLSAITSVELGITVPNAHDFVKQHADHCTQKAGGQGAVREVSDLILESKGLLEDHNNSFLA